MSWQQSLKHEIRTIGITTLYFGLWLAILILIKQLILAEYQIEFFGVSKALVGALILAKVVLVLERVSLGRWVGRQPAFVDVLLRTLLYALGVLVVLALEKGIEGRAEYGGFFAALAGSYEAENAHHVLVNTIVVTWALLVYNLFTVIRRYLGGGSVLGILLKPVPPLPQDGSDSNRAG